MTPLNQLTISQINVLRFHFSRLLIDAYTLDTKPPSRAMIRRRWYHARVLASLSPA